MLLLQPSWASYLITGVLAMTASLVLTSCRFGNHVEKAPNPDQITGYYSTEPQKLYYCVDTGDAQCAEVQTNGTPALVSGAMTNPVALLMKDLGTGEAYLANSNGSGEYLPIVAESGGRLSFSGGTAESPLWVYSDCTTRLDLTSEGSFDKSGGGTSANGHALHGRVKLDIQVTRTFNGSCTDSLQELYDCYYSADDCRGSTPSENAQIQASVQELFNPYIQAGVMTPYDIPSLTALAYVVQYQ